jgi:precorrin-6Y C5,15-methyltransferase (decarboxylating)
VKFYVIGITDNPRPFLPPEVLEVIRNGKVFSGGKRHHEIVKSLLPEDAEWIDITVPLDAVFERYHLSTLNSQPSPLTSQPLSLTSQPSPLPSPLSPLIVFASGDPLFFGFANTIRRKMPDADIVVYPTFNSLQMLAHRLVTAYHDMRIVSLTGRPWQEFDRALMEGTTKIGVLTDKEHTPAAIARRMMDYGYQDYEMHIGEHLGHPAKERITSLPLEAVSGQEFAHPNCLILIGGHQRRWGLPDGEFALLDGREKMITKMPIRLLTLQALDLPCRHVFWDIGFCTGSVSIEARLQFPHLHIEAFEIRPECEAIIHENARHFGAPGINLHMGDFLTTTLPTGERLPDAVFIGGHGGRLKEIMAKVLTVLSPDGVIVMNSVVAPKVTTDSRQLWDEACQELGLRQEPPLHIQHNDNHPITILKCSR